MDKSNVDKRLLEIVSSILSAFDNLDKTPKEFTITTTHKVNDVEETITTKIIP